MSGEVAEKVLEWFVGHHHIYGTDLVLTEQVQLSFMQKEALALGGDNGFQFCVSRADDMMASSYAQSYVNRCRADRKFLCFSRRWNCFSSRSV